jgi:hypothetical protein
MSPPLLDHIKGKKPPQREKRKREKFFADQGNPIGGIKSPILPKEKGLKA